MTGQVVRYEAMCQAIDAAYEVDEVKDIRDQALAFEVYSRQAKNTEAERRACEIRLRAERKAGSLLKAMAKAKGGNPNLSTRPTGSAPTLSELGLTRDQSSNWQKLADVPEEQFEAALADPTMKPTTTGIIRGADEPKAVAVSPEALWVWGRMRDFDRDALLARDPTEVLETMTPEMLDDMHTLAPRVAAWLGRIGAPIVVPDLTSQAESEATDMAPEGGEPDAMCTAPDGRCRYSMCQAKGVCQHELPSRVDEEEAPTPPPAKPRPPLPGDALFEDEIAS